MENKVGLCGCGWLGSYLANHLQASHTLWGTTRHSAKFASLQQLKVSPLLYTLGGPLEAVSKAAEHSAVILNIPPGRNNTDFNHFTHAMCELVTALSAKTTSLVFISTTAVYGEATRHVVEDSPLAPHTASARAHQQIEQHVIALGGYVLRLAGLVGPDRHPVRSLAGKSLHHGNRVVNLVQVEDVVQAIAAILARAPAQRVFQLCSAEHPTRGDYYPRMAAEHRLAPITFCDDSLSQPPTGKVIDASATLAQLGLTLAYPSPWQMLAK